MAAPNVAAVSSAGIDGRQTSFATTFPAGTTTGDLVLLFANVENDVSGISAGWTLLTSQNSAHVWARVIEGGDSAPTVTPASSSYCSWGMYRYDGSGEPLTLDCVEWGSWAEYSSENFPDQPALTATGGTKDRSWVVFIGDTPGTGTINRSWPSGWDDDHINVRSDGDSFAQCVAVGTKDTSNATEDPGTWAYQYNTNHFCNLVTLAVFFGPTVTFSPPGFGAEAGFQSGVAFEVGADVTLFPKALGAEAGFQPGISFRSGGARQVMLTGGGIETAEMTTGGTEGDVLTYHDGSVPTWEVGGGGASALDDLTDVDAAAPSDGDALVWSDGDSAWIAAPPSGVSDIVDIPTAEMDDTLVLAPDGAGGVEFRAETGGSQILDWVSVTDYGAVGDDTTDDTTAIQDAIDATPQGGVCYFPVGTYRVTAALVLTQTIRLLGAESFIGLYSKVRQATANTSAFIGPTTGSQHWVVDGLFVAGPIGGQTAGAAIETTQSVNVRRCRTQGFQDGLRVTTDGTADDAVYYTTVEESFFDSATRAGIYLDGNVNNFTMRSGRANGNAYGLRAIGGPLGLRLYGVDASNNLTAGISIDGTGDSQSTAGALISGCYFEQADSKIDLDIGPTTTVYNVRIESCVFIKSNLSGTGYHIDADHVEAMTVTDCYFTSDDVLLTTANTDGLIWANNINVNAGTVTLQTGETLILDPAASVSPEDIGSTDAGTSPYPARADHVHGGGSAGTPASTVESETTWGITPAVGTDTEYARQDHTHGTPAAPASGGIGPILITDTPSTPLVFADLIQNEAQDDLVYADL